MKLLNCSKEEAQALIDRYKETYKGVQEFYDRELEFALEHGYVVSMFSGLHLKVPNLLASSQIKVEEEIRTMNNFLIQSSGFATLRAIVRIQKWIEDNNLTSDIKIINSIYDSIYFYVRNDAELIERFNKIVVELMTVPMLDDELLHNRTELEIGSRWDTLKKISNTATQKEILETLKEV